MKILFITQLFPYEFGNKYTSSALREFVDEWGRKGHQVKVIRPHYRYEREKFPPVSKFKIGDNIEVEFIRPIRVPLLKSSFYSHRKILRSLDFKPDIIICHLYNSYFTFHKLASKLAVPLVIGIHSSDTRIAEVSHHWRHQDRIFGNASAFACRSHSLQNRFSKLFPQYSDKTFIAPSGIPKEYLQDFSKRREQKGRTKIITVTHLIKRKQVDVVLNILASLQSTYDFEFTIIGSGVELNALKRQAKTLGLEKKVIFKGQLGRNEVITAMLQSDIFMLPSYRETLGLVYLEAMACGCITIGAENEGIDGILRNGENGFLCDATKPDNIKLALIKAMELPANARKNMRNKALATIKAYNTEEQADKYLEQMRKICNDYNKA